MPQGYALKGAGNMKKTFRVLSVLFIIFLLFICFRYFYPGKKDMEKDKNKFEVLAHRGLHTNWKKGSYHPVSGCEAKHIYEPAHEYIENTMDSISAAFNMGATIVEIDIRRTKDDKLMVFHDYMLECRTNGEGHINTHTMKYLKTLDIGYGYTHDDGKTYPLRGKGMGKMPEFAALSSLQ